MGSARYRELKRRTTELRNHFLPATFDPTGTYSERIHDRARAYRMLTHAEIEAFLEDRVVEVANEAFRAWSSGGTPRLCLMALLAFEEATRAAPTSLLNPPQKRSPDFLARVARAKDSFNAYARSRNHGVKEDNVLRLLLPLGIREHEIDLAWLMSLDAFGSGRGLVAHQTKKVQAPLDPLTEYSTVQYLLAGLETVDKLLKRV